MKHNKQIILSSGPLCAKITSHNSHLLKKIKENHFLKSYIPSLIIEDSNKPDIEIILNDSKSAGISENYPSYTIGVLDISIKDIITLVEHIFEKNRQSIFGIDCLHASGTVFNDKSIIFWGGTTGIGKTTMAEYVFKNLNGSILYDEKVILDFEQPSLIGGIIKNNKTPINKRFNISMMIHPVIEHSDHFSKIKLDPIEAEWHLYEESSRKIRGVSRRVNNFNTPIQSLDNKDLASGRIERIRRFCQKIPVYYMRGKPESIIQNIKEILN